MYKIEIKNINTDSKIERFYKYQWTAESIFKDLKKKAQFYNVTERKTYGARFLYWTVQNKGFSYMATLIEVPIYGMSADTFNYQHITYDSMGPRPPKLVVPDPPTPPENEDWP